MKLATILLLETGIAALWTSRYLPILRQVTHLVCVTFETTLYYWVSVKRELGMRCEHV